MGSEIRVEFDVPAEMRDGTVLRATIFRPADKGSYPVVLVRTPYGKDLSSTHASFNATLLARAGYIVVVQDVRGRGNSGGTWAPFKAEADDGYDTVEWAAQLPGSTGAVGMIGPSYLGYAQWSAATAQPPHLKAIFPLVTWADASNGLFWRGGALELGVIAYWQIAILGFDIVLRRYAEAPKAERGRALGMLLHQIDHLREEGYLSLPLEQFAPAKAVGMESELEQIVAHPYQHEYSAPYSVAEAYQRIQVPSYNVGGWYDLFCSGTLQNFTALRQHGATTEARQTKLLIGPWSHASMDHVIGTQDFGVAASSMLLDLQGTARNWFDYWLKGIDNGTAQEPPIKIFVMGDNSWRYEQEWPLARTSYVPYCLRSGGRLSRNLPGEETPDQYLYDPSDPTPTLGGATLMHQLYHTGVYDQRSIEARSDVLSYSTEPLIEDLETTGPVSVTLWAASDAVDTDFVARLIDVHPDGFAQNITDGIIRARYRNGETPELLEPGRPYQFTIDLWSTSNVFKVGHRIRLDIASASFPRWDRNPNTDAPFGTASDLRSAQQTILHDAAHPSHVLLPVIPRG